MPIFPVLHIKIIYEFLNCPKTIFGSELIHFNFYCTRNFPTYSPTKCGRSQNCEIVETQFLNGWTFSVLAIPTQRTFYLSDSPSLLILLLLTTEYTSFA
jgi:hypothetical protein